MGHVYHTTLGSGGRLVIPAGLRQALGLNDGDGIVLEHEGGSVRLVTPEAVLDEVQAFFRDGIPEGVSLVEELLAERREEARREQERSGG
jgi:AbrB family looped-hinge helix DNA binding protein